LFYFQILQFTLSFSQPIFAVRNIFWSKWFGFSYNGNSRFAFQSVIMVLQTHYYRISTSLGAIKLSFCWFRLVCISIIFCKNLQLFKTFFVLKALVYRHGMQFRAIFMRVICHIRAIGSNHFFLLATFIICPTVISGIF
jgi:hypothetical protein